MKVNGEDVVAITWLKGKPVVFTPTRIFVGVYQQSKWSRLKSFWGKLWQK